MLRFAFFHSCKIFQQFFARVAGTYLRHPPVKGGITLHEPYEHGLCPENIQLILCICLPAGTPVGFLQPYFSSKFLLFLPVLDEFQQMHAAEKPHIVLGGAFREQQPVGDAAVCKGDGIGVCRVAPGRLHHVVQKGAHRGGP